MGKELVYLDSAATTHKPECVLAAMDSYYRLSGSSVHRAVYRLAEKATQEYENVRQSIADFFGVMAQEIIFTRGATDGLNFLSRSLSSLIPKGAFVVTRSDHHSNFVPWQQHALQSGRSFLILELDKDGIPDVAALEKTAQNEPLAVVAFPWVSNVVGIENPIESIARVAKKAGAITVLDGTQGIAHRAFSRSQGEGIDFFVCSGHKMYGPQGVGILCGRSALLQELPPTTFGGDMILDVQDHSTQWASLPLRFEAGTPPIAEVLGLGAAFQFLKEVTQAEWDREHSLVVELLHQLELIPGVEIVGPTSASGRTGLVSFGLEGIHPHDLATFLDSKGICVRAGHHCAQPLLRSLGKAALVRASVGLYNTHDDIHKLCAALTEAQFFFQTRRKP